MHDRAADRLRNGQPLRVGELAKATGYSTRRVQELIDAGRIDAVRAYPGAQRRIPAAAARRFLEALAIKP